MALVPVEANSVMALAAVDRPRTLDGEPMPMYRGIYRAMVAASPGSGKVSRERYTNVETAINNPSALVKALPNEPRWQHQARAVIAALGLEIEE